MNPKVKAALWPLLAALCGALASYFATGCTPAQIDKVNSAADSATADALCVKAALQRHSSALVEPGVKDIPAALELHDELRACLVTPDAGN